MTDQEQELRNLAQAERYIAQCKEHIARQQKMIERLAQHVHSTPKAEGMLEASQASLRAFETHRRWLLSQMEAKK